MKKFLILLGLISSPAWAERVLHTVRVEEAKDFKTAVDRAKTIATKIDLPLDEESLKAPRPVPLGTGPVVRVFGDEEKYFVVSFVTYDVAETEVAIKDARAHGFNPKVIAATLEKPEEDPSDFYSSTSYRDVIILGSYKTAKEAEANAQKISKATKIHFEKSAFGEDYYPRRYSNCDKHETCLTVEKSGAYRGFRPNLYIVVGGIGEDKALLARYKRVVPDAYSKSTVIYYGCIH